MTVLFGIPLSLLMGQLLIGLINGLFYAMMSMGVAIIFGMLRIGNFVHGAQYMLGAFGAWTPAVGGSVCSPGRYPSGDGCLAGAAGRKWPVCRTIPTPDAGAESSE